ncbi:MAG TPA: hypothetical protein VGX37_04345 [Allosphingosinicella sp.]|jgi:PBP1b-binding outer membrane lipoprotein LpoB|nr:hypothetical protein [Allosphingosinicella sp.]
MKRSSLAAAAAAFTLLTGGCSGRQSPADNTAQALDKAAEQSTPEAAATLENAADQVREHNVADPAAADRAMQAAGNAQAPQPPAAPRAPTSNGQ